eukprot:CAMPEP_0197315302 /NCGR_PEP_ID=MMETSP0891-20130614/37579_1 /TAXON_ID=44058 ORGANISM="Aureoumbra lagunensis, Strain CCMP1510" /NCGR_SAMPLE_ID=MMETSP0891 /ASSEMBLY_ACC=CAM_ASM_000534 /LENGTH=675 /DNA_ID=CAMNT_0042804177 /DNA_START=97 /DNA_END=2125 /DNA_ORIENTATION=-
MAIRLGTETAVYALSEGRQMPEFLSERQRRNLQKSDEEVRRRITLLQDFEFENGTSQRLKFSGDGQFLVVTGMYPPRCKVFELSQLGMKYERRLGSECVDLCPLTCDLGKMAFLLSDRTLELHAPYGTHYKVRVPTHGRSLAYDAGRCMLWTAAAHGEIHGLDLDAGSFVSSLLITDTENAHLKNIGLTRVQLAPLGLPLLAVGAEDGQTRFFDIRTKNAVAKLNGDAEITALAFDPQLRGLRLAIGDADAAVKIYDMRKREPISIKHHQYELPIADIHFTNPPMSQGTQSSMVISADPRVIKIWDPNKQDKVLVNVETAAPLTRAVIAPLNNNEYTSGLLLAAGDQSRIMAYYIPKLGPAPRWCSFLESITEELEEAEPTAFDDFRFVSKSELAELKAEHLIGTNHTKPYMHGFFIDAKLYRSLKAIAQPFNYDEWRKEQQQKKLKAKREASFNGILESSKNTNKLPKVNAAFAQRILEENSTAEHTNPLGDNRFSKLFTDKHYQIDEQSPEYLARHPSAAKSQQQLSSQFLNASFQQHQSPPDDDENLSQPSKSIKRIVTATHTGLDAEAALGLDARHSFDHIIQSTADEPIGKRLKSSRSLSNDTNADAFSSRILGSPFLDEPIDDDDDDGGGFIKEITFIPSSGTSSPRATSEKTQRSSKKKKKEDDPSNN